MPTQLDYLADTFLFESTARIIAITETERGIDVTLDRTIFYPQGGGQPADHGQIISANGTFDVTDVRLDPEGVVHHFGAFTGGEFSVGEEVRLTVDGERRTLNARLHSAGHLIDVAMQSLNLPHLKATKGYHFTDGPYVEYDGMVAETERDALHTQLQAAIDQLIAADLAVEVANLSPEEAAARGMHAPAGKSVRTVGFAGHAACGCGGTHVSHSAQIGTLTIRKISSKKGTTRISYEVA